jgi:L-ribulose-5-phosphate 4-epimerase
MTSYASRVLPEPSSNTPDVKLDSDRHADGIRQARRDLAVLHGELVRYGLVVWTTGKISAPIPGSELMVIKPSGVSYDELTPESMVVCDLRGEGRAGCARAVQRRSHPRLHLPAAAGRRRHRPHALEVRHGVGCPA